MKRINTFLFIGGPADGKVLAIECVNDRPPSHYHIDVGPTFPEQATAASAPVLYSYERVCYECENLRDKDGVDYFVFVMPGTNVMRALIEGYRRSK